MRVGLLVDLCAIMVYYQNDVTETKMAAPMKISQGGNSTSFIWRRKYKWIKNKKKQTNLPIFLKSNIPRYPSHACEFYFTKFIKFFVF